MRLKDVSVEGFFKTIFAAYLVMTVLKFIFAAALLLLAKISPAMTIKTIPADMSIGILGAKFYPSGIIEIGYGMFIAFVMAFIGLLIFSSFMHWVCQRTRIGSWKIG